MARTERSRKRKSSFSATDRAVGKNAGAALTGAMVQWLERPHCSR